MKSFGKLFSIVIVALMTFAMFTSCSDDQEDGGSPDKVSTLIVGYWCCISQTKTEDGDTIYETYDPSSLYHMEFDDTGNGYMTSGSDELFEISGKKYFRWTIKNKNGNNYLITDVYGGEEYKINKLNDTTLDMTWTDEDYSIRCVFERMDLSKEE